MEILTGHVSPETAYVVNDYPYGFRLRCKIRYWLDHNPKQGVRLVSQTTNPKVAGEVWNKPKASTYCKFAGAMYLDDNGHVTWSGLHEYMDTTATVAWVERFGAGVPETCQRVMAAWVKMKLAYEARQQQVAA